MHTFDKLWTAVSLWAELQAAEISKTGRSLTPQEIVVAKKVGVQAPEKIRVLNVLAVPFPEDPAIHAFGIQVGLPPGSSGGMTLGYGIFIRDDHKDQSNIWPHELRHVAQYECLGSIKAFMFFYLKELLHFRYGLGPLEVDAKNAEQIG
jgi:hypothetical protein